MSEYKQRKKSLMGGLVSRKLDNGIEQKIAKFVTFLNILNPVDLREE